MGCGTVCDDTRFGRLPSKPRISNALRVGLGLGSIASEHIWAVLAIHVLRPLQVPVVLHPHRVLVSLLALEELNYLDVHWPSRSAPQYSILALRPSIAVIGSGGSLFVFPTLSCVTLIEWLIHTPTSSTLVDIGLHTLST